MFGDDLWPYRLDANRTTLATATHRYATVTTVADFATAYSSRGR